MRRILRGGHVRSGQWREHVHGLTLLMRSNEGRKHTGDSEFDRPAPPLVAARWRASPTHKSRIPYEILDWLGSWMSDYKKRMRWGRWPRVKRQARRLLYRHSHYKPGVAGAVRFNG
jgi:hypothetical protein